MKKFYLLLIACCYLSGKVMAQSIQFPCTLQANINIGICIDIPCIPLYGSATGGTPPYQYLWFNGGIGSETYLNYGSVDLNVLDTCLTLTVTDAMGCVAFASARYFHFTGPFPFDPEPGFVLNDTFTMGSTGGNFEVKSNDHVFAQNYVVAQAPKHGDVILNADGTGTYTPFPNWCGPDYFRYTAADTSGCNYGQMATAWIEQAPCAGITPEKTACNNDCNGQVSFYQNGVMTPPLTYLWSNGNTGSSADSLCEGLVSVTITDAMGVVNVYNALVEGSQLQGTIIAPTSICNSTFTQLFSSVFAQNISDYSFFWTGPGIYGTIPFESDPQVYCSASSDSVLYSLQIRSTDGCVTNTNWPMKVFPSVSANMKVAMPTCPNDTLEISLKFTNLGNPPYHYIWSGPKGVQSNWSTLIVPDFSSLYNGLYAVTVTDINGCYSARNNLVSIADTCAYKPVIYNNNTPFCTGTDIALQFGMTPDWVYPEFIEWSGPNGFYSNQLTPLLQNAQVSMTGWYHLSLHIGSSIVQDSAFFIVNPDALSVADISLTPPTKCFAPLDGKMSLTMTEPPPYQVKYSDMGSYQNVNTNPITRNSFGAGQYSVNVKKNGCIASEVFVLDAPDPPQISLQHETCAGDDGTITVSSIHPLTCSWKLPDESSLNNHSMLNDAVPGAYILYAKDETTKCVFRDTLQLIPYLDFQVAVVDTPSCTSTDGSLLALSTGNATPPVTFNWSNGFIGNPNTGLAAGGYSITLTDDAGCSRHRNAVLPPSDACIAQVTGRIYIDTSCLCMVDSNTVIFPFAKVCATNGVQTTCTWAENTGMYALALTEPGQYTLQASTYLPNAQSACTEFQYQVGQDVTVDTSGVDFFFCGAAQSDLEVTVNCGIARPGFAQQTLVQVRNNGIINTDTSLLTVTISPLLSNLLFSPPTTSYNPVTGIAQWKMNKLAVYQQYQVGIRGTVMAALGDTLNIKANVESLHTADPYGWNNTSACSQIVSGSFDPNDKTVYPLGISAAGNISSADTVLTYTIRFQNTGTDTAFTVVLRDTLDEAVFDLNSIHPLVSSHPYHLRADGGNILIFTFEPIILLDSARNMEGSKGFVMFSIRLKNDLPPGTHISNSAAIYFDYNAPVITNEVYNTLTETNLPALSSIQVSLMPNPTKGQSLLSIENTVGLEWVDISIIGMDGRHFKHLGRMPMLTEKLQLPIDSSTLPSGLYVILVRSNWGKAYKKLVVISE